MLQGREGKLGSSLSATHLPRPPANPNERPEVEAFLLGFAMCLKSVNRFVTGNDERNKELFNEAIALAKEIYPDFDPVPASSRNIHTIRVSK